MKSNENQAPNERRSNTFFLSFSQLSPNSLSLPRIKSKTEENQEHFSFVWGKERKMKWGDSNCRFKERERLRERMTGGKDFKNRNKKQKLYGIKYRRNHTFLSLIYPWQWFVFFHFLCTAIQSIHSISEACFILRNLCCSDYTMIFCINRCILWPMIP